MNARLIPLIALSFIALLVLFGSVFTVQEGQQALINRLGEIQKNASGEPQFLSPGIHFKLPLIDSVIRFDTRMQTLTIDKARIMTKQKKDVLVDYYVKWRIVNLSSYFISTGGKRLQAEQLLTQQINNALRAEFGTRDIEEVVSDDRSQIMASLNKSANTSATPLGVTVIDVRIKTIDLPDEVSTAVFNRMQAERARVAAEHRSQGQAMAEAIRAKADADATVIVAKANSEAAQKKAKADQEAAKIYADAYKQDPNFYAFYQSLESYRKAFAKNNNLLVLNTRNDFFKYFNPSAKESASTGKNP